MLNPSDDHRWVQFYQQIIDSQGSDQASSAAINPGESTEFIDTTTGPGDKSIQKVFSGSPKRGGSPGLSPKPIRRRSRASKRTPATVLNANTNNFRALVQQFTGCPSTAISFKGPVNLSFSNYQPQDRAAASALNNYPYSNHTASSFSSASVSLSASYGQQQSGLAAQLQPESTNYYPQRGSSVFSFMSNDVAGTTATTNGFVSGQISTMELETAMSLDEGFAAMDSSNMSVHGLPTTSPNSFSWG
ncbi:VQ motif-containing protein 22 [Punica granatum]|uniref:VQ domain-containing protein n=2 Tax=Punica granatum TaxID=22663 RepID=A0A218XLQ9_PUNGR|nr:VQ motif-containing protein 22 [Punica granatum]OWM85708.1 hypothetical protein CDL15_Pgr029131 [Punica granatum]PKI71232.1 hypothetical protein CRG98_008407 [Punica granatum]